MNRKTFMKELKEALLPLEDNETYKITVGKNEGSSETRRLDVCVFDEKHPEVDVTLRFYLASEGFTLTAINRCSAPWIHPEYSLVSMEHLGKIHSVQDAYETASQILEQIDATIKRHYDNFTVYSLDGSPQAHQFISGFGLVLGSVANYYNQLKSPKFKVTVTAMKTQVEAFIREGDKVKGDFNAPLAPEASKTLCDFILQHIVVGNQ